MKKTLKLVCLVAALVMLVSCLAGCSGRKKGYPPVYTSEKRVVMTVGGYNVAYDFYRYLFLNAKADLDKGDESFWTKEGNTVDLIKDEVYDSLKSTYAMFKLADEYEITLDVDAKSEIETIFEKSKAGMTNSEFKESLAEAYMTEELYRFILEVQQLELLVFRHVTDEMTGIINSDDDTVKKAVNEEFVRATHILFKYSDESEKDAAYQEAQSVLALLKNGEDFETLKEKHSDDTDLKGNTDGYYFTKGEFKNAFEDTAFELEIGGVSEIISTDVGYHIVKRLPIEEEYVSKNFDDLRYSYKTSRYYKLIEEQYEQFTPKYEALYKSVELDTFE